jgi:predicted GTPase|tara:strand:+ start:654 stop:950 length:297 start_codon:yes stop_codon:yes gene_type:complete
MGKPMAVKDTQAHRLQRIEDKVDKLADAMISLARAEEKLIAIEKSNHNHYDRMNKFSGKLDEIEKKVDANAHTVSIINKVVYLISAAIIAGVIKFIWM